MFTEPLFHSSQLQNLRLYRYSSIDKSPITKYSIVRCHRWKSVAFAVTQERIGWDLAALAFPIWMAPNMITLLGLVFILFNVVTLAVYDPALQGIAPSWVYFSWAGGLFLYQTFDNVDGRQARRTKTSSALGHIFDHTIDSLNCPLGGLLQVASVGLGNTKRGAILALVGCWPMWFSTWEEYHTHTLYLGTINGPTEGLLLAMLVHIISGYFGTQIWHSTITLPEPGVFGFKSIRGTDLFLLTVIFAALVIHTPSCIRNVKASTRTSRISFPVTLWNAMPFLIYLALAVSWLFSPHSAILSENGEQGHLFEFSLLITCTFGKLGPRVILAYLARAPFPWFNWGAFGPFLAGALLVNLPRLGLHLLSTSAEIWCLRIGLLFAFLEFLQWWTALCLHFCSVLDINCLTIKQRPVA